MIKPIKVYIKLDAHNNIVAVASSVFLKDTIGWVFVDEGEGDRYAHAQSQYLKYPITDFLGSYNYIYANGVINYVGTH